MTGFLKIFLEKTSIIFQKDSWSLYNPISTEMHLVNESNLSLAALLVGLPTGIS